jgi:hypothetical protein
LKVEATCLRGHVRPVWALEAAIRLTSDPFRSGSWPWGPKYAKE